MYFGHRSNPSPTSEVGCALAFSLPLERQFSASSGHLRPVYPREPISGGTRDSGPVLTSGVTPDP